MLTVDKGWQGTQEVNRVVYDPEKITIEEMAGWLEEAKTLVNILDRTEPEKNDQ